MADRRSLAADRCHPRAKVGGFGLGEQLPNSIRGVATIAGQSRRWSRNTALLFIFCVLSVSGQTWTILLQPPEILAILEAVQHIGGVARMGTTKAQMLGQLY